MKEFACDCVNPIWDIDILLNIIDNAKSITRKKFLENCNIDNEIIKQMRKLPYDYEYYQYKDIFFYVWSMIEHFYIEEEKYIYSETIKSMEK